jgi:hypothetical protein
MGQKSSTKKYFILVIIAMAIIIILLSAFILFKPQTQGVLPVTKVSTPTATPTPNYVSIPTATPTPIANDSITSATFGTELGTIASPLNSFSPPGKSVTFSRISVPDTYSSVTLSITVTNNGKTTSVIDTFQDFSGSISLADIVNPPSQASISISAGSSYTFVWNIPIDYTDIAGVGQGIIYLGGFTVSLNA